MENKIERKRQGSSEDFGVVDEPLAKPEYGAGGELLEKGGEDQLKIKKHASALVQFIKRSHTPITIGIQGEWGSGKTSLLNTIYAELELANQYRDSKDVKIIWVNTWENALMSTPEEALIKIINEIINELLESDEKIKTVEGVKKAAATALKGILRVGASAVGGVPAANVMGEILQSTNSIRDLRNTLTELVQEIRESPRQDIDKVVIFIDDLDRIDPPEAVRVLELLKNVFSIRGCVFILAIDYQVVIQGLKAKFGERTPENEWEFRAFFDKIIQLPFLMPMSSYNIGNYVNHLLRKIDFQDEKQIDADFIKTVVDTTIGGNPRSIKRLINSLALINIFNEEAEDDEDDPEDKQIDDETERKLLFALVCLQIASSDVYSVLSREPDFLKWDDALAFTFTQKKEEQDKQFQQNFEAIIKQEEFDEDWEQALYRICYANPRERAKSMDLAKFFNFLRENLGEKNEINLAEQIAEVLGRTSVTSVVTADDISRAPKGSYKRNYAEGFEGWIKEVTRRNSSKEPKQEFIKLARSIIDHWEGHEFNAVEWKQGDVNEGCDIRYTGQASLYHNRKKIGSLFFDNVGNKKECLSFQVLKNPDRDSNIVQIGKLFTNHCRPYKINREEKKIINGHPHNIQFMTCRIDDPDQNPEDVWFLFKEGKHASEHLDYLFSFRPLENDSPNLWPSCAL